MRFCECGALLSFNRRVCDKCRKAKINESYRRKDVRRRADIKSKARDKDITLAKLYERDSGVCYLCGGVCNWNDHAKKDGAFIAGDTYPSVDHVKPLALGGSDTWANIKLAHFRCNTLKRDRPLVF